MNIKENQKEINEILKNLDENMGLALKELELNPEILLGSQEPNFDTVHDWIFGWRKQIHDLWVDDFDKLEDDNEEETDIDFQQARKVADNIINYLSKNFKGFKLIDLMVRCEKKDIPDYQVILNPSINNYIEADDQILTQIVQTYDENLIVRNNIIIHVVKKRAEDISEQERILGINQIKQTNKNYAEAIAQALDKLK